MKRRRTNHVEAERSRPGHHHCTENLYSASLRRHGPSDRSKDAVTGLLPLHVKTDGGKLVAVDHIASGLDMGRTTAGLVILSQLAHAEGDPARADKYLKTAEENYKRGEELLAEQDYFVQRRDFDDQGNSTTSEIGEPNKSAHGGRCSTAAQAAKDQRSRVRLVHRSNLEPVSGVRDEKWRDRLYRQWGILRHLVTAPSSTTRRRVKGGAYAVSPVQSPRVCQ